MLASSAMEGYLASLGAKQAKVAVLNYVGSLCPITLGHVECLVLSHRILTGKAPSLFGPIASPFAGCIGLIRVNGDGHVQKKLQANGEKSIAATDRLHLCRLATAEHEWIHAENVDMRAWLVMLSNKFPHLQFVVWHLNGADDVIKYRKWTQASESDRFITPGRPGYTQPLLDAIRNAGTPQHLFVVAPEVEDISSTEARKLLAQGDPANKLPALLAPSVIQWCQSAGPWGGGNSGAMAPSGAAAPPAGPVHVPATGPMYAATVGTVHAVVKRPDNVRSTVLRKIATNARDDSAWVEDHTKVRAASANCHPPDTSHPAESACSVPMAGGEW